MSERAFRRAGAKRAARRRRRAAGLAVAGAAIGAAALPAGASALPFTVTTNADSGPGSLRQAVLDANMTTPSDTIGFAPNVTGTINLSSTIVVTRSTIIDGPGADKLKIVNPTGIAFFQNDTLPAGINVEFEGLTVEGHSAGPGSAGGAFRIGSGASSTIRNCVISGSTAGNQGGGIFVENTPMSIIDSTFTGNVAGGPGGAIFGRDTTLAISGSTLSGNKGFSGGAISITDPNPIPATSLSVTGSTITGNQATTQDGGGIEVASADGPTSIVRSTVSGNSAGLGSGGGLYFGYASSLSVDSSTFAQNTSQAGAGLYIEAPTGPTLISDSTIASNTTVGKGGGIYSFGYYDKPVRIQNSTVSANTAGGGGGGIYRFGFDATAPGYEGPDEITLSSTIVANNLSSPGSDLKDGPLASGSFHADHSIIGSTTGAAVADSAPGTNFLNGGPIPLSPLADNGGPTQTMLPSFDGIAIDAGAANGLMTDQRGLPRSFRQPGQVGGDGTDIGAVELGDLTIDGAELSAKKKQKVKGKKVVIKVKASAKETVEVAGSGTVKLGKKKLMLTQPTATLNGGEPATLKLKPKGKRSTKKIAKVLAAGKKAKVTISVEFTDAAGNTETEIAKTSLSAKTKK